ncbi:hypothetical protein GCM10009069_05420 [Algimonas arctica]|uniref:Uncharacterized protein n=1 Tax=Algimonas arctica TaxID=1479486 RepID=A0A8J3CMA0_9PROT|nr:hypothetical protein [Algimonas arctica]GHA85212.1 hypothetical protein GCM10009069_05420 [Algimonas arctica]
MMERLDRYLPKWGDLPITDVKRSGDREEHRRITTNHGATIANNAMCDFCAAYNFALKVVDDPDALPGNPVATVAFNKDRASNRVIMPEDLANLWTRGRHCQTFSGATCTSSVLSGLRPGTLVALRQDWVRLNDAVISISRMKLGRSFGLPLSGHINIVGLVEHFLYCL